MTTDAGALFPANEAVVLRVPEDVAGLALERAVICEALGHPYRIDLELIATESPLAPAAVLGKPMSIHLNLNQAEPRHFHGLVSECASMGTRGSLVLYRVTLRPRVWFLSRSANCRIFQNKTLPEIIKEVLRAHGYSDIEEQSLTLEYERKEFVVQYRETDLSFISRLMEDVGLYYYFKHDAEKHTLVLCDDIATHEAASSYATLPFFPPDAQRREHVEYIDRFEVASRVEAGAYAVKDFDFEKPQSPLVARNQSDGTPGVGDLEVYDYPGQFTTVDQGEQRARVRMQEQVSLAERAEGHSNARGICCGKLLLMSGHPVAAFNQEYLVLETVIRIQGHAIASGAMSDDGLVSCDFVAQAVDRPFRLARVTPRPIVHGAQTAIVTGPAGEEIWMDPYGRVRVKFHWDRRDVVGDLASCWVRVSQLWAGAGFGGMHIPRIDQEVIVEFLDGDPDRPIIVGRVYNGTHDLPFATPTQSGIRSATVQGGFDKHNEIRFEDAKGEEELFIQAQRNKTLRVKASRSSSIGSDDALSIGGNHTLTVQGNMNVAVGDKGGKYELTASSSVQISAPEFIELKCGGSTLRISPSRISLQAGDGAGLVLDANLQGHASGGADLILSDSVSATSANGKAALLLDAAATLESGQSVKVQGMEVEIVGTQQVRINS